LQRVELCIKQTPCPTPDTEVTPANLFAGPSYRLSTKCRELHMKYSSLCLNLILISAAIVFGSCSDDTPTESRLTLDQQLQKALDNGIQKYGGKGISAAIIFPDGYTWDGAAGISHGTAAITTETLFSADSITKSFTAVTIIKMVEDGTITLDDPVRKWFPPYANIDSTVSIRQLLNHTSGIFNITENPQLWQDIFSNRQRVWSADKVLTNYVLEPYFPRGTGWHYCNTGYIMLRKLIHDVNGAAISEVYRNRIFDPCGLTETYLYAEETLPGTVAHGWFDINGDNSYEDITINPLISFYSAAGGGIFATALDLALWARKIFIDGIVVTEDQLDQITDFYTPIPDQPLVAGYGLGLAHFNPDLFNGLTIYGHSGDAPGYAAGSLYLADYNVCLGIADNTQDGDNMWVINDLLAIITEHLDK